MHLRCLFVLLSISLLGCSAIVNPDTSRFGDDDGGGAFDAGDTRDASPRPDAGDDAGRVDAGPRDGGPVDGGPADGGVDGGPVDGGPVDGGPVDGGPVDGGPVDGGPVDGGPVDGGCIPSCVDGVLDTCAATVTCPLGCSSVATRCGEMVPSNVPSSLVDPAGRNVDLGPGTLLFDTTTCSAMSADTAVYDPGGGAPSLCVLIANDFIVRSGTRLNISGERPLVILANGNVTVEREAVIDVSARGDEPGPGGADGGSEGDGGEGPGGGAAGTHDPDFSDGGGAGAAFCGAGGAGGQGGDAEGGAASAALADTFLIPLRGGSGGGSGRGPLEDGGSTGGVGGAGGGSVQITALGAIRIQGLVLAGGGGGGGGARGGNWGSGGGGGSGGGILLEAPILEINADAAAIIAGGGGGGGAAGEFRGGEDGQDGAETLGRADGGGRGGPSFGAGGGDGGGGDDSDAEAGASNPRDDTNGGGGGGGAGCVVLRNMSGTVPDASLLRVSARTGAGLSIARLLVE